MRRWIYSFLLILLFAGCINQKSNLKYVDPFIGTDGHGHTYPGATMPFGMVQLSPDTRLSGWDGSSGYHYSDSIIYGFSHTHLSGTGASDYGDILIMPTVGEVRLSALENGLTEAGYASLFSHENESASPGYYSVFLEDDQILAELTSSQRVGFHKYTFPKSSESNIILDLEHRDPVLSAYIKINSEFEIEGLRRSSSWAKDQYVYFVIQFSKPFKDFGLYLNGVEQTGPEINGRNVKAHFSFTTKRKEEIYVKVAISAVSVEGARQNMQKEILHWKFDRVHRKARIAWNDVLSKYDVLDERINNLRKFYTAVYHQYLSPNMYMDVDSLYRGRDMLVHKADGHDYYTLFSLWDTFRATHPLFNLMEPEVSQSFVKTFLQQYEQTGLLPVWELSANETGTMIGYHAVSVIADAWRKGIRDFDPELVMDAVMASAEQDHFGLRHYKQMGYIPAGQEKESVSRTLEYAYDDWCIAELAEQIGLPEIEKKYRERSQNFQNLFDPESGFFRAKSDALWVAPFNPLEVNQHYTEANAWQYLFSVQHDMNRLSELLGGVSGFARKLDELFSASSETSGRDQADITGMIGQYAHGNEPSHHVAYLYNYAKEPWKTQRLVSEICQTLYTDQPDGLCGNEDCGQMSAWYIFSAIGFYPVTPGSDQYVIGSPQLKKIRLLLSDEKVFEIEAHNLNDTNVYVDQLLLNGIEIDRNYILHDEVIEGGRLEFFMSDTPNLSRGIADEAIPGEENECFDFIPVPYISSGEKAFEDRTRISLDCIDTAAQIKYQFVAHNSPGSSYFRSYSDTVSIRSSRKLRTYAQSDTLSSAIVESRFYKLSANRKVIRITDYSDQYAAGGDQALIDQIRGARNYATGPWQGYEGKDVIATVDLGFNQTVNRLGLSCLQDQESWIFMPSEVIYEISTNGVDFEEVARVQNELDQRADGTYIQEFTASIWRTARFVRVKARNIEQCPDWHSGAGEKSWIFCDELIIE